MPPITSLQLGRRIDAAQGKIPCDGMLRGAKVLDVFHCEWRTLDVGWIDGVIVSLDAGISAKRELEGKGTFLVPGFIDAHVHVESSLVVPGQFEKMVLPKGTTTAVCDPHELTNVLGTEGLKYFLDAAEKLKMDLRVMLSSCVPATHMETNGGGQLLVESLLPFRSHPKVLGLAEMMNVPGVLNKELDVLAKVTAFSDTNLDGHSPLVKGRALSAYLSAGINSCHECSELEEAREKLIKGMRVWIREGSVAKDLHTLIPLLTLATSTSMGFCTDDRNPLDTAHEGHLDFLVRTAIKEGVPMEIAYRTASWSVARHYGLDRGIERRGAIAPGYIADMVWLSDAKSVAIRDVFVKGTPLPELDLGLPSPTKFSNTIRAKMPMASDLEGPKGNVHVIGVKAGKIVTGRTVEYSTANGVAKLSVLERHGKGSKPANAYVRGFGENFEGAISSSVGHDSHNLITVGSRTEDMAIALRALEESGGGIAVVQKGKVLSRLSLPLGGLMSSKEPGEIAANLLQLREASRSIGCELAEPFLQLAFLSLPVIPSLKLTDKGLVDVDNFKIIPVSAG